MGLAEFYKSTQATINMQSMAHQSVDFIFTDLVAAVNEVRGKDKITKKSWEKASSVISKALDMNIIIAPAEGMEAYMRVPMLSKNHVLANDDRRAFFSAKDLNERLTKAGKAIKGGISPITGRAWGFMSEIPVRITIGNLILKHKELTSEEVSAIILHEVGHGWTYMYLLDSTLRTNQAIDAALADYTLGQDKRKDKEFIVTLERHLEVKLSGRNQPKNNTELITHVLKASLVKRRSEFDTDGYDESGSELLADQIVARLGAGSHVITALTKIASFDSKSALSTGAWIISQWIATLCLFTYLSIPLAIYILTVDRTAGDYDNPYNRTLRVRNQLKSRLRAKLTKEERRDTLKQIKVLDEVMERTADRENVFAIIASKIFPSQARAVENRDRQRKMESLLNPDLDVALATLNEIQEAHNEI